MIGLDAPYRWRRQLAAGAVLAIAGVAGVDSAHAQAAWPERPVRIVIPFTPGASVDVVTRMIAPRLGERLGQPVVVENRPGAGANIGIAFVARAPADGYTLLGTSTNFTANPSLFAKVAYDPLRDFVPVVGMVQTPSVLVVAPDSPVRGVGDLIARARAKPGGLAYASGGNGSLAHLIGEMFKIAAGIPGVHVPYRASPDIISSLLGQQTDYAFPILITAMAQLKPGKLRAVAVTGTRRSPLLPDVPTMREAAGIDVDVQSESGLVAPAGTPPEVVARLNAEIVRLMRDPAVADPLLALGYEIVANTPAQQGERLRADVAKFAELVRKSGAKVD